MTETPQYTIGPYTILEELGRGGQGTVYLAEDDRLGRRVALKMLSSVGPIPEARLVRFRREAEAASKLDHPHICTIYEAGEVAGVPFIAMQHVAGETLASCIGKRRLYGDGPEAESAIDPTTRAGMFRIVALIENVARALHHAHETGLIHRDVKPGNVMVTNTGDPVVLDFGLARTELVDEHDLTHTGDLLGTPAYMSPEQLTAQRIPLDRRTDVYSLGATLYECLTSHPPFQAATRAELYQRIISGDPQTATTENKHIPRDLQVVLETAMERDRDRRYRTALEFADDLRRVREFEPILARPIGRLLRLRRFTQRHPVLATAAFGALLALVIALVFVFQLRQSLRHAHAVGLAKASGQLQNRNPRLALHLALEACDLELGYETVSSLYAATAALREVREFSGHEGGLWSAVFSADGRRILTASRDGTARLWNLDDDESLAILRHEDEVLTAAFSPPDGELVLTASADGTARLWSPAEPAAPVAVFEHENGTRVHSAVFSNGRDQVLTAGADRTARLWDRGGKLLATMLHQGPVKRAVFSPDAELILTICGDGKAYLWSRDGAALRSFEHQEPVVAAAFSPDGARVFTGPGDNRSDLWSPARARMWSLEGEELASFDGHAANVRGFDFSPRGDLLVTASLDPSAILWDFAGNRIRELRGHETAVWTAVFSPRGDLVLTASFDETARVYNLFGDQIAVLRGHKGPVTSAVFSPDGRRALTASFDGTAKLWDARSAGMPVLRALDRRLFDARYAPDGLSIFTSGQAVLSWTPGGELLPVEFPTRARAHYCLAFSPDHEKVLSTHATGLQIWNRAGVEVGRWSNKTWVFCGDFSPDGKHIVTASSDDKRARIHDLTGATLVELRHGARVNSAMFSPDGAQVVTASDDHTIGLWDKGGALIRKIAGHEGSVTLAVFSPDGGRILSASGDNTARLWDREGELSRFEGHEGEVRWAEFSPDGERIVTASRDKTARLWDLEGRELAVLRGHDALLWRARFSPDGTRVITASFDGSARIWFTDVEDLLDCARRRAAELPFRPEERARYTELLGTAGER